MSVGSARGGKTMARIRTYRHEIKEPEVKTHRAEIPLTYREKMSFLCKRYGIPAPAASVMIRIANLAEQAATAADMEEFCKDIELDRKRKEKFWHDR